MKLTSETYAETRGNPSDPPNQDAAFASSADNLIAVFDGVGSDAHSALASHTAAEFLKTKRAKEYLKGASDRQSRFDLEAIFSMIEYQIEEVKTKHGLTHHDRARSTAVIGRACLSEDKKPTFIHGHKGDSRLYRFRNAKLNCLTLDHNEVMREVTRGIRVHRGSIQNMLRIQKKLDLTADGKDLAAKLKLLGVPDELAAQIGERGFRRVARLLEYARPDGGAEIKSSPIKPGDIYVAVTDGVLSVPHERFQEIMALDAPLKDMGRQLLDEAQEFGQKKDRLHAHPDDVSVAMMRPAGKIVRSHDSQP